MQYGKNRSRFFYAFFYFFILLLSFQRFIIGIFIIYPLLQRRKSIPVEHRLHAIQTFIFLTITAYGMKPCSIKFDFV